MELTTNRWWTAGQSLSISFPFILYLLINNNPAEVLDNRIKEEMEEEMA